jgi:hypothetical protein
LQGKQFAAIFVFGDDDPTGSGVQNAIGSYKDLVRYMQGTDLGIVSGTAWQIGDALNNPALRDDIQALSEKLAH